MATLPKRQNSGAQNNTTPGVLSPLPAPGSRAVNNAVSSNPSLGRNWGSNIWGSSSLTAGLGSAAASRNPLPSQASQAKTGSGLLVANSVSDDWDWTVVSHTGQESSKTRVPLQSRIPDASLSQKYQLGYTGKPNSSTAASQAAPIDICRPSAINLSTSTGNATQPYFGANFTSPVTSKQCEQPPNVYTKLGRRTQIELPHPEDSLISLSGDPMFSYRPTDDCKTNTRSNSHANPSMPASRNNSLPPSRHSNAQPEYFPKQDLSSYGPFDQKASSLFRNNSFQASQSSTTFANQFESKANHILPLFGQMTLDQHHPSQMTNVPTKQFSSHHSTAHSNSHFGRQAAPDNTAYNASCVELEEVGRAAEGALNGTLYSTCPSMNEYADYYAMHSRDQSCADNDYPTTRQDSVFLPPFISSDGLSQSRGNFQAPSTFPDSFKGQPVAITTDPRHRPMSEQQAFNDPRWQHLLANQLRGQYCGFYVYGNSNGMQIQGMPQYLPVTPSAMPLIQAPRGPRELEIGNSMRSVLLEEFKNNTKTSKRFELKEIYDHVVEFSGDQHGSRFIQQKLETANSDEKERIFREIQPNAIQLMTDVFGNYVIQKFFEHGDQNQKKILASKMKGQVLNLSLQMYGCRVVQKAIEHILTDQQAALVHELEHNVIKCVKDQNGNHVIQKAIERCPPHTIRFIMNAFVGQVQHLSIHPYGCRVIQRCLEHCDFRDKRVILQELHDSMTGLIGDQYGNYVVQHVVEHGDEVDRTSVLTIIAGGLEHYSKHKYASNVVEKCLYLSDDTWRHEIINVIIAGHRQGPPGTDSMMYGLIRDQFGNYVIQKLLDVVNRHDYNYLMEHLQPEMARAKKMGCGKQAISIEKKMHRFGPPGYMQMHIPMSFGSHSVSTDTTPPPLTADMRSLQTSSLPSINGDAVGGAANSRKGSEPSSERSERSVLG